MAETAISEAKDGWDLLGRKLARDEGPSEVKHLYGLLAFPLSKFPEPDGNGVEETLSLTLADLGGVGEGIFHSVPDMARNFDTVSARP